MSRPGWEPGTRTKLHIDFITGEHPVAGDLLATRSGASYTVLDARESPSRRGRFNLDVERLPYGSVDPYGEGVWTFGWYVRPRRRRAA